MKQIKYFMIFGFLLMLGACMDRQNDEIMNIMDNKEEATRDIIGNNAFLYYKNYQLYRKLRHIHF